MKRVFESFFLTHKTWGNRIAHGFAAVLFLVAIVSLSVSFLYAIGFTTLGIILIGVGHWMEGEPPALVHRFLSMEE